MSITSLTLWALASGFILGMIDAIHFSPSWSWLLRAG